MISIQIPGQGSYELHNLVLDMNGTLAVDGLIADSVVDLIQALSASLRIHIITADTHGKLASQSEKIAAAIKRVYPPGEASQKAGFIESLNPETCLAIGNGQNDVEMLRKAKLSIAVIGAEGCAFEAIAAADIVVRSPEDALNLLINTNRLIATLRK